MVMLPRHGRLGSSASRGAHLTTATAVLGGGFSGSRRAISPKMPSHHSDGSITPLCPLGCTRLPASGRGGGERGRYSVHDNGFLPRGGVESRCSPAMACPTPSSASEAQGWLVL